MTGLISRVLVFPEASFTVTGMVSPFEMPFVDLATASVNSDQFETLYFPTAKTLSPSLTPAVCMAPPSVTRTAFVEGFGTPPCIKTSKMKASVPRIKLFIGPAKFVIKRPQTVAF